MKVKSIYGTKTNLNIICKEGRKVNHSIPHLAKDLFRSVSFHTQFILIMELEKEGCAAAAATSQDLDSIITQFGSCGKYQAPRIILILLVLFSTSIGGYNYLFYSKVPEYR